MMKKFVSHYFFPFLMIVLGSMTIFRYSEIKRFRDQSREYSFVIRGDVSEIALIGENLRNFTYQPVDNQLVEEGTYKFTFRCPPDKIGIVRQMLEGFKNKEGENE